MDPGQSTQDSSNNPIGRPSQQRPGPPPRRRFWLLQWILILIAAMLVVPSIVGGIPQEISNWYYASAIESRLDGNLEQAVLTLDKAVRKDPQNASLIVTDIEWRIEWARHRFDLQESDEKVIAQYIQESIIDRCTALINDSEKADEVGNRVDKLSLYLLRANAKTLAGDPQGAVQDILKARKEFPERNDSTMANALCYFNALAETNLEKSLVTMNSLIGDLQSDFQLSYRCAILLLRNREYEAAVKELDRAIAKHEEMPEGSDQFKERVSDLLGEGLVPTEQIQQIESLRRLRDNDHIRAAWLYTFRGKALRELGRDQEADDDWTKVEELGESPILIAEKLNRSEVYRDYLHLASMWLDTRGYVYFAAGEFEEAKDDLDRAIRYLEAYLSGLKADLAEIERMVVDLRDLNFLLREKEEMLAVLLYHRFEVLESLGESDLAQQDQDRIKKLGYRPGPHLF